MNLQHDDDNRQFFEQIQSSRDTRNLRQIFEDDSRALQAESSNLRYQPHKTQTAVANNNNKAATTSATETESKSTLEKWSTLLAKVANGYKDSETVGRVGVALSRNGYGAAKLVVYKSRSHLLSTLLLRKSLPSQLIMRASYLQFYDDEQRFWSLRFEGAADESEFIDALRNVGLPIDQMHDDSQIKTIASTSSTSSSLAEQVLPQPLPRLSAKLSLAVGGGEETSSCDSECESSDSNLLKLHRNQSTTSQALVPATASTGTTTSLPSNDLVARHQLEAYLQEQRANGQAIDKKMDTILQTMSRMTTLNIGNATISDTLSQSGNNVQDASDNDNEDELLELEQKLLDFKKQNRALVKSLKQRDQAMAELRASSCALCEQLLNQNIELKRQNSGLIVAIEAKMNRGAGGADGDGGASEIAAAAGAKNCQQCSKHLRQIAELQTRVNLLQNALINLTQSGMTPKSISSANSNSLAL